jgi:hypothetical protein
MTGCTVATSAWGITGCGVACFFVQPEDATINCSENKNVMLKINNFRKLIAWTAPIIKKGDED